MKKYKKKTLFGLFALFLIPVVLCFCFIGSSQSDRNDSTFSIQFIDVGQGDAALIECDGQYMLIDGGDKAHGETVYTVLRNKNIQRLEILAISHLHADHIGGLIEALKYASSIGITICNSKEDESSKTFQEFEHQLRIDGSQITIPSTGDQYKLGSAMVEVLDVNSETSNDSLVLLITYKKTKFLFAGDIEYEGQTRLSDKYENDKDESYKIDLIKMPHHGSYEGSLYRLLRTFMPDYAIISVGKNNNYGHPSEQTLDLLENLEARVFRTDNSGDIIVKSDGNSITVETAQ